MILKKSSFGPWKIRRVKSKSVKMRIHENLEPFDFYGSLYWAKKINNVYFILVQRYPASIRYPLIEIQNSISDYQQLKSMRNPIYFSYICTFIFITLWSCFYQCGAHFTSHAGLYTNSRTFECHDTDKKRQLGCKNKLSSG